MTSHWKWLAAIAVMALSVFGFTMRPASAAPLGNVTQAQFAPALVHKAHHPRRRWRRRWRRRHHRRYRRPRFGVYIGPRYYYPRRYYYRRYHYRRYRYPRYRRYYGRYYHPRFRRRHWRYRYRGPSIRVYF